MTIRCFEKEQNNSETNSIWNERDEHCCRSFRFSWTEESSWATIKKKQLTCSLCGDEDSSDNDDDVDDDGVAEQIARSIWSNETAKCESTSKNITTYQ